MIYVGLLIFAGLMTASYFLLESPDGSSQYKYNEIVLGFGELFGLLFASAALIVYVRLRANHRSKIFRHFVADNTWRQNVAYDMEKVAGVLMGAGWPYLQKYALEGSYNGKAFTCVIFQFDEDDSRTRSFISLRFKLEKSYPMLVIDNTANDRHIGSNLPNRIPDGVPVSLEGNFDTYYSVSVVKNREREAVHILSPDFMAALEDVAQHGVDVELCDKDLFLVYEADFYSEKNLASLFSVADVTLKELDELTDTWLASSPKREEIEIARLSQEARKKLMYKFSRVSIVAFFVLSIVVITLIVVKVIEESA